MVTSLLSIDQIRRRNWETSPLNTTRNAAPVARTSQTPSRTVTRSIPKPLRLDSFQKPNVVSSGVSTQASRPTPDRTRTGSGPSRPSTAKPAGNACFFCGKVGHFKNQCPELPTIREMIQEIDNPTSDEAIEAGTADDGDNDDSEPVREGNDEA